MKIVKISPKFQITIPKIYQGLCASGSFSLTVEENKIILRPIEITPIKTSAEILDDFYKANNIEKTWEKHYQKHSSP